jgi:hypothetical protein
VTESFFLKDEMDCQEEVLVSKDMPFIYTTFLELLKAQNGHIFSAVDEEEPAGDMESEDDDLPEVASYTGYSKKCADLEKRFKRVCHFYLVDWQNSHILSYPHIMTFPDCFNCLLYAWFCC